MPPKTALRRPAKRYTKPAPVKAKAPVKKAPVAKSRSSSAPGQVKKTGGLQNASSLARGGPKPQLKAPALRAKGPTLKEVGNAAGGVSRNFARGVDAAGRGVREFAASVIPFSRNAQESSTIGDAMRGAPAAREALKKFKK